MKTKHYFSFVFASLFLIPSVITAQDVNYQKEFDTFQEKQQKEYKEFKNKAEALVRREAEKINKKETRDFVIRNIDRLKNGERDLYI